MIINKNILKVWLVTLLLSLPFLSYAASPGAGDILQQQIKPFIAPAPSSPKANVEIEKQSKVKPSASVQFMVNTITIVGNTLFDTQTLHMLAADQEGKELTLAQLQTVAARITEYYQSHGYLLTRAIIPAQTIKEGSVTIEVLEAKYDKIGFNNHSRVNDLLIDETLSSIHSGTLIEQQGMDRTLLLLSDIPGLVVNATLVPGESVGTSDLMINTEPGPFTFGFANVDNYGNKYTGRERLSATVYLSNPWHRGDLLSFTALTSGSRMNYGRANYELVLNGKGTRAGGSYSALNYTLGDSLTSFNAYGTADVISLWAKHPLSRSRNFNFYSQLQFDQMTLNDHIDTTNIKTDRQLKILTGSLLGDERSSNAVTTWSAMLTLGHVDFENNSAQQADTTTAKTAGNFSRLNLNLSRLQSLDSTTMLYVAVTGQWTSDNLDSSQKMAAGGPYSVRAYDMGALSGDEGYLGTVELRHRLDQHWQTSMFFDGEHVVVNKNTWAAGDNHATLFGAGVGVDWKNKDWTTKAYVATRIGLSPALVSNSSSTRIGLQIDMKF